MALTHSSRVTLMFGAVLVALAATAVGCTDLPTDPPIDPNPPTNPNPPDATAPQGRLLGPIAGVAYTSTAGSGITGPNGEFRYAAGKPVKFSIGATVLGSAPGAATLTLFDLVGIPQPPIGTFAIQTAYRGSHLFQKVIAIAIVLTRLDSDADGSNGFNISAKATAAMAGTNISFRQGSDNGLGILNLPGTWAHPNLRAAVKRAELAGAFSAPQRARTFVPEWVVRDVYRGAGVDPKLSIQTYVATVIDDGEAFEETYTFASNGTKLSRTLDDIAGVSPGAVHEAFAYNNFGSVTSFVREHSGVTAETGAYTYDANGNPTLILSTEAISEKQKYTYDADGNVTQTELFQITADHVQPVLSLRINYGYDSNTKLISLTETTDPQDGNPPYITRTRSKTYDANSRLIRYVITAPDGSSYSTILTYNAAGFVSRASLDAENDGTADWYTDYVYDAQGNVLTATGYTLSDPNYPNPGGTTRRTYDARGNVLSISEESEVEDSEVHFTYDANGSLTRMETGWGIDIIRSSYNATGSPTSLWSIRSLSRSRKTFAYDANGYLASGAHSATFMSFSGIIVTLKEDVSYTSVPTSQWFALELRGPEVRVPSPEDLVED